MHLTILAVLLATVTGLASATASTDVDAQARRLINSQGCKACHRLDGDGASLAPDLDKVGARFDKEQLRRQLVNPQHRHGKGRIADFSHLRSEEVEALATFLSLRR